MVRSVYNERGSSYPKLEVHEPVAANYYPINSMIAIDDGKSELAVITDVSVGGSSIHDGEVELMLHRRVMVDDSRGVQEPLNETMCGCNDIGATPGQMGAHGHEADGGCECEGLTMRGKSYLVFDTVDKANAQRRVLSEALNFPPTLAFSHRYAKKNGPSPPPPTPLFMLQLIVLPRQARDKRSESSKKLAVLISRSILKPKLPTASALVAALPPNVKLLTLTSNYKDISGGEKILLRLAHLYSVGEHPTLSQVGEAKRLSFTFPLASRSPASC